MATATPVPTSARSKGARWTSSARERSAPASPGRAYRGRTSSGEVRRTGTSSCGWGSSGTSATLAAGPRGAKDARSPSSGVGVRRTGTPEIGQHALRERLGGPPVAPSGDGCADQERSCRRYRSGQFPGHRPLQGADPRTAEHRAQTRRGSPAVDGALCGPAVQVGTGAAPRVTGRRPAVQLVQLADEDDLDTGDEARLGAKFRGKGEQESGPQPVRRRDPAGGRPDGRGQPGGPGHE